MKIRCQNCYRVLDKNEEYCKSCGAHSEQMRKAMATGNYGGAPLDRFKMGALLFLILAFFGNGIIMVTLAVIKKDSSTDLFKYSYSLLFSSILTLCSIIIVHHKDLIDFLWNGNKKQFSGCLLLGLMSVVIVSLLSLVSKYTSVIPNIFSDYLHSGYARFFSGKSTNASFILLSLISVAVVEEIVFRRLLIDAIDDSTMLSDSMVILVGGLVGTIADFAWMMSVETVVTSLIINLVMTGIYANSNRSLGLNVFLRILIIVIQFLIFYV